MISLARFLFVFFLGWSMAVWIYGIPFSVKTLSDLVYQKVTKFLDAELLGMPLFEKSKGREDQFLPDSLKVPKASIKVPQANKKKQPNFDRKQ